ncbi:MAG: membrane lipoprotein lipid attachment site-containing protein [Acidimicrobiia bacterium]|nr:membrane lipoprotein lipid attachment site-containing protein [Acidimicrobiia bacterium]
MRKLLCILVALAVLAACDGSPVDVQVTGELPTAEPTPTPEPTPSALDGPPGVRTGSAEGRRRCGERAAGRQVPGEAPGR